MSKLYFRYGPMGSSKTAQVLMTRFNYIEKGYNVWLIKPSIDNRDGNNIIRSRIGIEAEAYNIAPDNDILELYKNDEKINVCQVIIADESQFFTRDQILQLRKIVSYYDIPVFCYGLRTDFRCRLFPGSEALFELADDITDIKSVCRCGQKAIVTARFIDGKIVSKGEQILIGGNDLYEGMCWTCWNNLLNK